MLLNDLDYYGTRLPRPPVTIERQFKVKLLQAERVEERAKRHLANVAAMEYFQKSGARIQALYGDDENPITWYDAIVDRVILRDTNGELLPRPTFQVTFPEYGNTTTVLLGEIDLPGSNDLNLRQEEVVEIYNESGGYPDGNRGRGGFDNRSNRGRYEDHRGERRFDDPRRHRGEERYDSRDNNYLHSDRSRSRDRNDNNLNDARREERELMEEVLRRERDKTSAKGKSYATRPSTFKDSLSSSGMHQSKHLDVMDTKKIRPIVNTNEGKPDQDEDSKPAAVAAAPIIIQKTAAELAAIEEKKRKLIAKYG
jgi:pre-mRNA-splicing factor 38B